MFRGIFDTLRDLASGIGESISDALSGVVDRITGDLPEEIEFSENFEDFETESDSFEEEIDDFDSEDSSQYGETYVGGYDTDFDDFVSNIEEAASDFEDKAEILERIQEDLQQMLDDNVHPWEAAQRIGYMGDEGLEAETDDLLDQYKQDLIDKLDLSESNSDSNWTERQLYASYEDLIDYLESFNGGMPDDDIIDIVITDEGYRLYVAIDSNG